MVGDLGLTETVDYGERGLAVDAGHEAMAEAETRGVAGPSGRDGETAGVDGGFDADLEELGLDEGVELLGLSGVAGLVGEAGVDEEAVGMLEEIGVEGADEVLRSWLGFRVATQSRAQDGDGE